MSNLRNFVELKKNIYQVRFRPIFIHLSHRQIRLRLKNSIKLDLDWPPKGNRTCDSRVSSRIPQNLCVEKNYTRKPCDFHINSYETTRDDLNGTVILTSAANPKLPSSNFRVEHCHLVKWLWWPCSFEPKSQMLMFYGVTWEFL
jgi:hypothetical protein